MKRIFGDFAYGPGPRTGCWWDETIPAPAWPTLRGEHTADVVVVGGGFTGMSAALHLAEAGIDVAVLEASTPGFGASGRNGGFCCLGGSKRSFDDLCSEYGPEAARDYQMAERAAVELVDGLVRRLNIDIDRHSNGETQLAHRPKEMEHLRAEADRLARAFDVEPEILSKAELPAHGLAGDFHGALSYPIGFGLNPRKYLFGLAQAAATAGARQFQMSPVVRVSPSAQGYVVETPDGMVRCAEVIIATNGYSSEDMPDWMAGRYLPSQSTIMVTRPMSDPELEAQGWTSDQMSYDSRNLLHYFRLMPDRRFLFGMRGGLLSGPISEARARRRTRRDFERMFPAWKHVQATNSWSGFVCLTSHRLPYVGPVPGSPGMYAGFAYHGNGVAMGSYSGYLLASSLIGGNAVVPVPKVMQVPPPRFPLGRARRLLMGPVYLGLALSDRL